MVFPKKGVTCVFFQRETILSVPCTIWFCSWVFDQRFDPFVPNAPFLYSLKNSVRSWFFLALQHVDCKPATRVKREFLEMYRRGTS